MQDFGLAIATGADHAVIAHDTVLTGSTVNAVMPGSTIEVIVLTFPEEDVITAHAVDDVVSAFPVKEVIRHKICRSSTKGVVEKVINPWSDPQTTAGGIDRVIGKGKESAVRVNQSVDVSIVSKDEVGIAGMTVFAQVTEIITVDS
jgi:hypothetical protein